MRSVAVGLLAVGLLFASKTERAIAHGAIVEVTQGALTVNATFDSGEPMANAQVIIYSPADLKTPWATGETDENGQYVFSPEAEMPGTWEITVRQAGHGGTTTVEVGGNSSGLSASSETEATSAAQKWISIVAVIWGFVGTALFFSREGVRDNAQPVAAQEASSQKASSQKASGGEA